MVKRTVPESLGFVVPLAGSQIHLPRVDHPIILDISPHQDDGIIGGTRTGGSARHPTHEGSDVHGGGVVSLRCKSRRPLPSVAAKQGSVPEFLLELGDCFNKIWATCNVVLSDMQRYQAGCSTKCGGLGLRTIADKTEAADIGSPNATH